jgi:hypothetical protein
MKIKSDFVTNSSSSSFVVIGTTIDSGDIDQPFLQKARIAMKKNQLDEDDVIEEFREIIETMIEGTDLSTACMDYYDDEVMIGICYTNMNDDETLGEFKERVKREIQESLGLVVNVGHIEEAWMDN